MSDASPIAEIKAIAKVVSSSLKREGHNVPHNAVLNALSAALNMRDWHVLKASLSGRIQSNVHPASNQEDVDNLLKSIEKLIVDKSREVGASAGPQTGDFKTLANRIKVARELIGMSQPILSEKSGVGSSNIRHLESGLKISSSKINGIAQALGLNEAWLKDGLGEPGGSFRLEGEGSGVALTYEGAIESPQIDAPGI